MAPWLVLALYTIAHVALGACLGWAGLAVSVIGTVAAWYALRRALEGSRGSGTIGVLFFGAIAGPAGVVAAAIGVIARVLF